MKTTEITVDLRTTWSIVRWTGSFLFSSRFSDASYKEYFDFETSKEKKARNDYQLRTSWRTLGDRAPLYQMEYNYE